MPRLFMLLIGATPPNRNIEQHDIFFSIGESLKDFIPQVKEFWSEAKDKIHFDAWREVTRLNGYEITITERTDASNTEAPKLFFLNLGGYKPGEFEEFHYKMIVAAKDKGEAVQQAKETAFFRHTGFKGANSHVDDKYGIDVDDIYEIKDILPKEVSDKYSIVLTPATDEVEDEIHLGYFKFSALQ